MRGRVALIDGDRVGAVRAADRRAACVATRSIASSQPSSCQVSPSRRIGWRRRSGSWCRSASAVAFRADVAAAERIGVVAAHRDDAIAVELDRHAARRLAERTARELRRHGQTLSPALCSRSVDSVLTIEQLLAAASSRPTRSRRTSGSSGSGCSTCPARRRRCGRSSPTRRGSTARSAPSEMTFVEKAGKRYGSAKPGGVRHEWLEVPWNWVAEQWLSALRLYERGFMTAMYAIHRLEPTATGTRVYLYYGAVPRNASRRRRSGSGSRRSSARTSACCPRSPRSSIASGREILELPPPPLDDDAEARLRSLREQLVAEGLVARRSARRLDPHAATTSISTASRSASARACGKSTRSSCCAPRSTRRAPACSTCRGTRSARTAAACATRADQLADVAGGGHCEACEIDFTTDSHEAVEVTFRVHPSIREVPERLYCSAEPATKEHIRVQALLAPGERKTITPSLAPGRYVDVGRSHRRLVPRRRRRRPERDRVAGPSRAARRALRAMQPAITFVNTGAEPRAVLGRARDVERRRAAARARCCRSRISAICSARTTSAPTSSSQSASRRCCSPTSSARPRSTRSAAIRPRSSRSSGTSTRCSRSSPRTAARSSRRSATR